MFFSQSKQSSAEQEYEFPPSNWDAEGEGSYAKKNGQQSVYTGRLKFFDEQKNYGFIVMDEDKSDIFVHLDDFQKAGVSKELLKTAKQGSLIR